ncbi:hypothetical protein Tco_0171358, partial [Tanacetum coccineum]
ISRGRCYEYHSKFKARVRGQYLTPHISYMLNLVFRYEDQSDVSSYYPLKCKIDGKENVLIIYPINMRQDGWFTVPLYQFTSQHKTADLQFEFEHREIRLLVAGIEFQPSEEKVTSLLSMVMLFIKDVKKSETLPECMAYLLGYVLI